jgi:hypothetical protein
MVAGNKVYSRKVCGEVFQGLETIVKSDNVNASPMIVPVTKKKRRFTSLLLSLGSGPFHKVQTVIIV